MALESCEVVQLIKAVIIDGNGTPKKPIPAMYLLL